MYNKNSIMYLHINMHPLYSNVLNIILFIKIQRMTMRIMIMMLKYNEYFLYLYLYMNIIYPIRMDDSS